MSGTQIYKVYIKASPERIWEAITSPEWNDRYGYRGRTELDLRPGGAVRGLSNTGMIASGAPEVGVDGEIIEAEAPHRLVQTFRMLMDPGTAAEGFTRLTYELKAGKDGVTSLTVTHELTGAPNLARLMAGEFEDMGAGGGWAWVLSDLKSLLETGAAFGD
ncbi:SRPBCC domain-containing protein [Dactylosporangium sp. NPDC000555]|uniref:SRPBCC domain-containing protein n=1 Tax=Dactylosporangium sp. NPDC000555 TaxID=3154260 RepID=UPI0033201A6A